MDTAFSFDDHRSVHCSGFGVDRCHQLEGDMNAQIDYSAFASIAMDGIEDVAILAAADRMPFTQIAWNDIDATKTRSQFPPSIWNARSTLPTETSLSRRSRQFAICAGVTSATGKSINCSINRAKAFSRMCSHRSSRRVGLTVSAYR